MSIQILLEQIQDLVNGEADFSERENRIYVKFIGIKQARVLQDFMSKEGFSNVYGAYDEGVYRLGFSKGGGF